MEVVTMPIYYLTEYFNRFFAALNPGQGQIILAAMEHEGVRALIEDPKSPSAGLRPTSFLQGSYKQRTAIDKINDIDVVVLCETYSVDKIDAGHASLVRFNIFRLIYNTLALNQTYRNHLAFRASSMCIKLALGIKVEVLPVIFAAGVSDPSREPFSLFRPSTGRWEDGFARRHQELLSEKNALASSNFIPMIKVLKHIRNRHNVAAVSFHLECLLYSIDPILFTGAPVDYIPAVLEYIASYSAAQWVQAGIPTPCGDRLVFSPTEWNPMAWAIFHRAVANWARVARNAAEEFKETRAIHRWYALLRQPFPLIIR